MQKITQFDIIDIMHIITVFRVVCFHRGYSDKGTIEGPSANWDLLMMVIISTISTVSYATYDETRLLMIYL